MGNELITRVVDWIAVYGAEVLLPIIVSVCFIGVMLRWVIFFTIKAEYAFAVEFEKRVYRHLASPDKSNSPKSFHQLTQAILARTYHEHFELKQKYKRRRWDHVTTITDRVFLIQAGVQRLVQDSLSQTKYLKKDKREPKFLEISKFVFGTNPVFNKVFGVFPMGMFNDVINLLPGLFVVSGIFGTFLGTMQALPALSQIDITNSDATKAIMDTFLLKMAHCMSASIVGIGLSVIMTITNAVLSPDGMYYNMVNKFTSSLEFLWNDTETNESVSDRVSDVLPIRGGPRSTIAPDAGVATAPAAVAVPTRAPDQTLLQSFQKTTGPYVPNPQNDTLTLAMWEDKLRVAEKALVLHEAKRTQMPESQWLGEKSRLMAEKEKAEAEIIAISTRQLGAA